MKKMMKLAVPLAAAMVLAMPQAAFADEDEETPISSVSLTIDSSITAGEDNCDVEVTTDDSEYEVDYVEVRNEPKERWEDGDKPKLKITLAADDDYIFESGFSKKDVDLSGDDAEVTSVSRKKEKLTISVTLAELEGDEDDGYEMEVYDLMWDKSDGSGYWDGDNDADRFEVRILRDGHTLASTLSTDSALYNFASYFTQAGRYTFKVRGVYDASHKGDWEESEDWQVSAETAAAISAGIPADAQAGVWICDARGCWYRNADQSYTVNDWQLIQEKWYFFDESGYRKTGWIPWKNQWYYCGADGVMLTNTTTPDGYYVGGDGAWIP